MRVGGDLNWDYRFCWLRDAALTVRALFGLGYREDAEAFVSWMLHATRLTRPEIRVLTAGLPLLPAWHPRMANEQYGPTVVRQLEPPGFLALHYGTRTPLSIVVVHLVYGAILGAFYTFPQ